jgi:hypothetical protein
MTGFSGSTRCAVVELPPTWRDGSLPDEQPTTTMHQMPVRAINFFAERGTPHWSITTSSFADQPTGGSGHHRMRLWESVVRIGAKNG